MQFGQSEEVAVEGTGSSRKKARTEVSVSKSFVTAPPVILPTATATTSNNTATTTTNMTVSMGMQETFSRNDLRVLDLLDHPIWIFDIVNKSMWWGNSLAVEYWNAQSLNELINRNFADDMSEAVHKKNLDTLERLRRNERVSESVTYYPNGIAKTMTLSMRGIYIDGGRLCKLCEAFPMDLSRVDPAFVRSVVTLQHLPLAVCQFSENGELTYQNPEACHTFGSAQYLEGIEDQGGSSTSPENAAPVAITTTSSSSSSGGAGSSADGDDQNSSQLDKELNQLNLPVDQMDSSQNGEEECKDDCDTMTIEKKPINHFLKRFVDRRVGMKIFEELKTGKDVSVEALVRTKRGTEWNAIHARLGKDAISADPIILFSARDISDIVTAKRETQLNKERAEFFAIMAHEIRTPLFQVTGFIDLLDHTILNAEQKGYVKLLKASASGLMTVINDVLDYSKLEAGKMKLDIVPFEPKAVVEGSIAAVVAAAEDKGLNLASAFPARVPVKLMGDPNRLRQILLNLLNNAVKFTHDGGIDVSVDILEDDSDGRVQLRFSVTDTGIGIDSKNLKNIFRKYSQAGPSISSTYGGTGLGLSICKSLAECMEGEIGVDSVYGKGSKFWFQIPFPRPDAEAPSPVEDPQESKEGVANLRVLVAEDNGVNQKLISKMLNRLGHEVTIAENGKVAVMEVQKQGYDLVLMDMQMPVMDGIDATKEIRSLGLTLPIVGLTASVRRSDFDGIGLDDWIGKPVRLNELQEKISDVV